MSVIFMYKFLILDYSIGWVLLLKSVLGSANMEKESRRSTDSQWTSLYCELNYLMHRLSNLELLGVWDTNVSPSFRL